MDLQTWISQLLEDYWFVWYGYRA